MGRARAADGDTLVIADSTEPFPTDEPYVRREFTLDDLPQSAIARVNVMGWFELYVNGAQVGPDVMSPAMTDYSKRSLYLTYDLKPFLRKGQNCIGLWISRGWYWSRLPWRVVKYDRPAIRLQLDLQVADKPLVIGTDASWTCRTSGRSITGSWSWGHFGGERVDARLDVPRWSTPELATTDWVGVTELPDPGIVAESQKNPPDRVINICPALSVKDRGNGSYAFDFGANLTGWVEVKLPQLKAGQSVRFSYSDGGGDFGQRDQFIAAGKPGEVFVNKFNYHGFHVMTVEGLPSAPALSDVRALATGASWETNGIFACSNPLINRLHELNLRTLRCLSLGGYMADCPHRERSGYGDRQTSVESCVMNFRMVRFYEKWMADWRDVQEPDGNLPHTAPQKEGGGGPAWGGTLQQLAWRNFLYYGDRAALEASYDACRRYVDALESHEKEGILRPFGKDKSWDDLGDWVPPGPIDGKGGWNFPSRTEADFFNNCYLVHLLRQLGQIATALGRMEDANAFTTRARGLARCIDSAFYQPDQKFYVNDKQSYLVMPLLAGVAPEDRRAALKQTLENSIIVKNTGHLDTGMLGTYFLLQYLQEAGRDDLIWKMVATTDYPGWGYMLQKGATTWWEQWDGGQSRIHSCYGMLDGWFYQGLAGIRPDPSAPGFEKIIIKPAIVGDLTWVNAHYDSIYGRIVSEWKCAGDKLAMHVVVPANTTAKVYLPTGDVSSVKESGRDAATSPGVKRVYSEGGVAVFEVGSGTYDFAIISRGR